MCDSEQNKDTEACKDCPPSCKTHKLRETQLDYAWKWFEYHANQRVSMFNFFLVGIGILFTALATLLTEAYFFEALAVSVVGILVCIVFALLDVRNEDLVRIGEAILVRLEREWLFANPRADAGLNDYGILSWDAFHREEPDLTPPRWFKKLFIKHGFLIRFLQVIVGIVFLLAVCYAAAGIRCENNTTAEGDSSVATNALQRKTLQCIYLKFSLNDSFGNS